MTTSMLNQGLYDAAEVARLLGHDSDWVVRWATPSANGPAVIEPTFERCFAFEDLVSFRVALLIRDNGVSDKSLRSGLRTLRERTKQPRPLAVENVIKTLATSGSSFLMDAGGGELDDIGRGGQGVFADVARLYLTRIQFDASSHASFWLPVPGVRIDPRIQAGAPCIDGTRILTSTVSDMLDESDVEDVALDFDISIEALLLADEFERMLAEGVGLAA
jgi:uncharacterized protein (DUF433 family)